MFHRTIRSFACWISLAVLLLACASEQQVPNEKEIRQAKADAEKRSYVSEVLAKEKARIERQRKYEREHAAEIAQRAEEARREERERIAEAKRDEQARRSEELRIKQEREAEEERIIRARNAEIARLLDPLRCTAEEIQSQCKVENDKFRGTTWVTSPVVVIGTGRLFFIRAMPSGEELIYFFEKDGDDVPRRHLVFLGGREVEGVSGGRIEAGGFNWSRWAFEIKPTDFSDLPVGGLEFAIYGTQTKYDCTSVITEAYWRGLRAAIQLARNNVRK